MKSKVPPSAEKEAIIAAGNCVLALSTSIKALCDAGEKANPQVTAMIDLLMKTTKTITWTNKRIQDGYDLVADENANSQ